MAIQLEFLSLIMPVSVLNEKYHGGLEAYLKEHSRSIGKALWHDNAVVRLTGAMDPEMIDIWIEKWTKLGFQPTEVVEGKTLWKDLCIVSSGGFSEHDSPWLIVDGAERTAWFRGAGRGDVVGRDHFR